MNFLGNTPNRSTHFRKKTSVRINDDGRGAYSSNSQNKFKTSMLKSSLCDYNDAYILESRTIISAPQARYNPNNGDKEVLSKN